MPNHTQTAPAENGQAYPTSSPSTPADLDTGSAATLGWPEHTSPDLGEVAPEPGVRGPVAAAWREGTLTRAQELDSLCSWVIANHPKRASASLVHGVRTHIEAARQAASVAALNPKRYLHLPRYGSLRERAMSNLDAAEAHLLNIAPAEYLLGQMPSLLQDARRHLVPGDPRREELGRIAGRIGLNDPDHPQMQIAAPLPYEERKRIVAQERVQIVAAVRAASSASLREQVRVRSFRNVVVATTVVMSLLAIALAIIGFRNAILLPLCFAPEEAGSAVVVCPTQQSAPFSTAQAGTTPSQTSRDIDNAVEETVRPWDLLLVELIGLTAAAVAAAAAIRKIRGSSERYGVPLALAALKLPTGALTAFLGLLLMRGQFVPGLSALDTSAQILAWALVFGYAQQLFTRLVDQQGQTVLNSVRGASKAPAGSTPT
jgi:hypothetical protein